MKMYAKINKTLYPIESEDIKYTNNGDYDRAELGKKLGIEIDYQTEIEIYEKKEIKSI
jgi:hypothetical protein